MNAPPGGYRSPDHAGSRADESGLSGDQSTPFRATGDGDASAKQCTDPQNAGASPHPPGTQHLPNEIKPNEISPRQDNPSGSGVYPHERDHSTRLIEAEQPRTGSTSSASSNVNPSKRPHRSGPHRRRPAPDVYGALDLGTNNCRLLLARPSRRGFKVVDAFSRIIRLGEGLSQTGMLTDDAMERTIEALKVCGKKLHRHRVKRARFIATEACRIAQNSDEFLARAEQQTGLAIEVLSPESEAELAVQGCASLIDADVRYVLVFDIGGGSSELIWLDLNKRQRRASGLFVERLEALSIMDAWTSLPIGVVTLSEKFGGRDVTEASFEAMVRYVEDLIAPFESRHGYGERIKDQPAHLLGTSGTVTTVAGIKLRLPRYDRSKIDGVWMQSEEARTVTYTLLRQSYRDRVREPCIGTDRADLVLAGCAILEAIMRTWPCARLRVADRGLREGILATLMTEDGVYRSGRRRRGSRKGGATSAGGAKQTGER